jgi:hypothetical protein
VLSDVVKLMAFTAEVLFSMHCFLLVLLDVTLDMVEVIFKLDRNEIMN